MCVWRDKESQGQKSMSFLTSKLSSLSLCAALVQQKLNSVNLKIRSMKRDPPISATARAAITIKLCSLIKYFDCSRPRPCVCSFAQLM